MYQEEIWAGVESLSKIVNLTKKFYH